MMKAPIPAAAWGLGREPQRVQGGARRVQGRARRVQGGARRSPRRGGSPEGRALWRNERLCIHERGDGPDSVGQAANALWVRDKAAGN